MDLDLREIRMPKEGLYRAGRWADVTAYPPPAKGIGLRIRTPGPPLIDGYPRWEDAYGRFSTAKFSASSLAAVGRTVAGYRRYVSGGINFLDKVKAFLSDPDEDVDPPILENRIPPAYFEDAYLLEFEHRSEFNFVDVEHPRTVETLRALLDPALGLIGASMEEGISQNRDRRVTRLALATLYDICVASGFDGIVGIRYRAPEPAWDAYVFWNPPRTDLSAGLVRPLRPDDDSVREAAKRLGLELPS